jgi:hypothetical protein
MKLSNRRESPFQNLPRPSNLTGFSRVIYSTFLSVLNPLNEG